MFCCSYSVVAYIILIFISVLVICRCIVQFLSKRCESYVCLLGKTVIVTGANSGIGYYAALDFAKRGARVILACRNENRAKEAVSKIILLTNNPNIIYKLVDFSSFQSIRTFCKDINATEERLDILVNNAGAVALGDNKSVDGLDISWQTNYLSPYLLTILLLDKLKQSTPSRVVNVSSVLAKFCSLDMATFTSLNNSQVYNKTKLANILFTRELARRLNGTQVNVYALHPGAVNTDILQHWPKWLLSIWLPIMKFIYKTAEQGAQTTIYCSVAKECENQSGKLYDECREIKMYNSAQDMKLAKDIFEKTAEIVNLQGDERFNLFN